MYHNNAGSYFIFTQWGYLARKRSSTAHAFLFFSSSSASFCFPSLNFLRTSRILPQLLAMCSLFRPEALPAIVVPHVSFYDKSIYDVSLRRLNYRRFPVVNDRFSHVDMLISMQLGNFKPRYKRRKCYSLMVVAKQEANRGQVQNTLRSA